MKRILIFIIILISYIKTLESCNFTINTEQISNRITQKRSILRLLTKINLTNVPSEYFMVSQKQNLLFKPFTFFYTSNDFYEIDIDTKGSLCNYTNGRETFDNIRKIKEFMFQINNVI
jgi:hypothetical protein